MPLTGPDILRYDKRDGIVTVTLNRPERHNALSLEIFDRLNEAWASFRDDPDARVAILTGAGEKAFCVGMDLIDQAERVAKDPNFDIVKLKPGVLDATEGTPWGAKVSKPVIVAVNGIATAGGFQLTMTADLRIVASTARFGTAEVKVGRGTPWAVPIVWQMPLPIALEVLCLGDLVPAARLHQVGWLNAVVPPDQLMTEARKLAATLRDNAPLSVQAAKESLHQTLGPALRPALDQARAIYRKVYESEDAVEGPRAFAEKRKPVWKGR
ncbi:MAG: enoyl-CoA hydratase/isomerase family protein [Chloroflexi bacterium]|nr:enoyl-CoA hydratase/isomerase family protein [Chloroflexota bacterium]